MEEEVSKSCYKTIKQSWSEIDKVAAKANGLSVLGKKFKTCRPLKDASRLKDYLRHHMYSAAAQYNRPPAYPFHDICFGIDGASKGTNILGWVFSGIVTCEGEFPFYELEGTELEMIQGRQWQVCSELVDILVNRARYLRLELLHEQHYRLKIHNISLPESCVAFQQVVEVIQPLVAEEQLDIINWG